MSDTRIKTAVGPTILLQSGTYFDLLDPANSPFTIEDIAHGLSMTCRFAGQCRQFYSVAEHSWHTSRLVAPEFQLRALMHDAAEAFIGDVTRPLKSILPEYKAIERNVEAAVMDRFATGDWNVPEVKQADLLMLHAEQAELMPQHPDRWTTSEGFGDERIVNFRLWSPVEAREAFLLRYAQLIDRKHILPDSTKTGGQG